MQKDSLEMTVQDRQLIREAIDDVEERKIVITHGTDTMVETAEELSSITNKTIILTGALSPALFKKL